MSFLEKFRAMHLIPSNALALTRGLWFWSKIGRNPWRNISDLRKLQERMFKSVLRHAYENVAFYRRLYRKHGVRPEDIKSLDDVEKLPIVTKQDLRQTPIEARVSGRFDVRKCREGRTSGSTGEPFRVYIELKAMDYLWALHLRRLFIYGYRPWQTIVLFGPYWAHGRFPTLKRGAARPRFLNMLNFDANRLSLVDDPYKNLSYLRAIKPEVIWCPPSYMRLLAQAVRESGIKDIKPRIVICGAEMLDGQTRSLVESAFQVEVFDEYGTVDVASRAIAWQCHLHEGYHVNMDAVHLEFVKGGETVSAGEEGFIVATSLFRYATPMIRYMIGDIGIPSEEQCPCGRSYPLFKSIQGRSDDYIVMPDGRPISPLAAIVAFQEIQGIKKFQIVQEKIDKIVVSIEPVSELTDVSQDVRSKCSQLFGDEVEVELVLGPISVVKGRKERTITSKVSASLKH